MSGVNKVIIVGNLGADPETKYGSSGTAVTKIRVATSENWKDKQTGEKQEKTEWHRITAFGKLAEIMGDYLKKGSQVYIEGKLNTSSYEKEGQTHYSTDIIAGQMQMLGGKGDNRSSGGDSSQTRNDSTQNGGGPAKSQQEGNDDPFGDSIPF